MEEKETCNCEQETCNCEECDCDQEETCKCEENDTKEHCCCKEQNETQEKKGKKNKKDKKLEQEIENLKEQNKDLENKLLVSKADFINYRKRKDDEVSKLLKYAGEDMIKDMLSTIDNFERAIALDDENLDDELSKFLEGFKMIYCNLSNVLEKYEVKAIDGNNKPFDPTYHQAVMTIKVEGIEPGMVVEVLQKGYLLKDRVIRTAMVKVSE